ncbi:MAG TPA: apolipoprotein N-acyltransferase, partial [Acidimicrobiia bacterium]|nr:apolipoprotein N-acyltransferase [Acidimicrobiia bacterium]
MATRAPARPAGWQAARDVLHGPLRTLVAGQAIGQGADGFAQIAFAQVVLFDIGKGATPARIAGVLAATLLPFSLIGPFAGVVIDRWDRRRVMVGVSIVRVAISIGAIAVVALESEPLAYAGILLLLSTSRFVLAAKGAALPTTVAPDELVTANAVSSLAGMVTAFGGAVIGATFVGTAPAAGFIVAGALYALSAVFFGRLPPVGGGDTGVEIGAGLRRVWLELADGARTIARQRTLRDPLLTVWGYRMLLGAGFIILVLIGDSRYRLHVSGYGLAIAITGAASFAGTLAAPVLARRYRSTALIQVAFPAAAIPALVGGFFPNLAVLVSGLAVVAFAFQVLKVLVDALVGGAADDRVRGRVFSVYDVLYNVAFVLAGLALVPLWHPSRANALLWWLGAAFVAAGLVVAHWTSTWPFDRPRARPGTRVPVPHRWSRRAAATAAGAIIALAFPAPSWWWLSWIALVPVLVIIERAPSAREGMIRSWYAATGFMLAMHHWLAPNLGPFLLLLAAVLGLLWVPWGWLVWRLLARPTPGSLAGALVLVPSGWVAIESIRSWSALGGPWGLLGASQWNFRPALAAASLGGVWLVSFLIVAVNTAWVVAVEAPAAGMRTIAVATAVIATALGPFWYAVQPAAPARTTARVAIVQPGIVHGAGTRVDQGEALTESLTKSLAGSPIDLVVWGESSFGYDLSARPDLLARLEQISREVGAPILINVDARRGANGGIYKTSVLITPQGVDGTYDKMRLVPFGEYIPFRFALGWLSRFTEAAKEDRRRGSHLAVLHPDGLSIGPLVCFESAFPDMTRNLANRGVDLIVVQSATSTFQGSWAPAQHASLAAVRAVETGRPVVHAALTGVSSVFDARGR